MLRNWFDDHPRSGTLTLYRTETVFGLTPGHKITPRWDFLLSRIVLSWKPHEKRDHIQFEVQSFEDVNVETGERIGPTESVAGLFSFVVDLRTARIIEVLPGALSPTLVLSTAALHMKRNPSLTTEVLTTLMAQEAVVAAEEMAHDLWNELGVSQRLRTSPACTTPRPEAVDGSLYFRYSLTLKNDARDAFQRALLQQASKVVRLQRTHQPHLDAVPVHAIPSAVHVGGEAGDPNFDRFLPNIFEFDSLGSEPFRMSRATRLFNHSRQHCLDIPESLRKDTADALLREVKFLKVDASDETIQMDLTIGSHKHTHGKHKAHTHDSQASAPPTPPKLVRVTTTKSRRTSFIFGPHLYLVTGVQLSCLWLASEHSPFSDMDVLLGDIQLFKARAKAELEDLSQQYIPTQPLTDHPEVVQAAYMASKSPTRNSLTPNDIESAMVRSGIAEVGDSYVHWFDLVRSLDFDNTGFMEYNEFFLLCHRLTHDQALRLAFLSVPCRMKIAAEKYIPVCVDFDAWKCIISVYSDQHVFGKYPTDRAKLKRADGRVWELTSIKHIERGSRYGNPGFHSIVDNKDHQFDFLVEEGDLTTFNQMIDWFIYLTRCHAANLDSMVDPRTLTHLAFAATHAFTS